MKFAYEFEQLCGTVYTQGNTVFTPDGNTLLSPVGNRVTQFDLINHTTRTFPFEARADIVALAVSPDSRLLITVDKDGRSLLVNLNRAVVLYRFNFKKPVSHIKFSPDNKYVAVSLGKKIQVWYTPSTVREFAPFVLHRSYGGHHDDITSLTWSEDSLFIITGSKDLTARIWSVNSYEGGHCPMTLAGHRATVVGAFFSSKCDRVYTIGRDGAVYIWSWESYRGDDSTDNEEENDIPAIARGVKWSTIHKSVCKLEFAKVKCVTFHPTLQLLIIGFSNGTFGLYEVLSDITNNIHTLSISQNAVNDVCINPSGDWLALASKELGQLLVWEWKSETYVLKQQGHYFDLNVLDYSPDGQIVATGADDAKVKLWNTSSGFCYVTFNEHTGPVTGVKFTSNGSAVVSSSLDGTVRAFDTERYKNFRTLTTADPVQFISLALDTSGQIVCAGTMDPFNIYVWSLQTGRLLDVLSGHEGPVTTLAFSPSTSSELILASGSWDHSVRLWNVYENKSFIEPLGHSHDVLAVAFRPDGQELVTATLNGNLNIWDTRTGQATGSIEGRRDIAGGRKNTDLMAAEKNSLTKYFTSVCYSADGSCILAGGESKYVCIYETSQRILLKKYQLSHNRSLQGVLDKLHSKNLSESGVSKDLLLNDSEEADFNRDSHKKLLGASRAVDPGNRRSELAIRTKAVLFSPTGRSWATASSEGLLVYSLNENMMFDPIDLDEDITPESIRAAKAQCEYSRALLMSLHLNEEGLLRECMEAVPMENLDLVSESLRGQYLKRLLSFLAKRLENSPHLEYYLNWSLSLLRSHGSLLREETGVYLNTLRALQKAVARHMTDLSKVCNDTQYSLEFLSSMSTTSTTTKTENL